MILLVPLLGEIGLIAAAADKPATWEKNRDQWNLTGGDHPYHYLGSAIWFTRIGHAMAEAMTELLAVR